MWASQCAALHEIVQPGCPSHSTPSRWNSVCVSVSSSTKYRCSRVSLHRDTQGQTAERGHSRLLSGDKSTVWVYFHAFDCKLKPTHSFKCQLMTQFWAPPPPLLPFALLQSEKKIERLNTKLHLAECCCGSPPVFISSHPKDQPSCFSPTENYRELTDPSPHPLVQPTNQPTAPHSNQIQNITKHIPLKWRADFVGKKMSPYWKSALLQQSHQCTVWPEGQHDGAFCFRASWV